MAKKKAKPKKNARKFLKLELIGLLFIFLAIFGSGASAISDGAFPSILENFFRFFIGIWYFVASIALLVIGIYLMVKRKYPLFFTKKLFGFYLAFLGVLLFTHIQVYEKLLYINPDISIFSETWENYFAYLDGEVSAKQIGGGIVGGLLFTITKALFSTIGAKIVSIFMVMVGFVFMTNYSLGELFSYFGKKIVQTTKKSKAFIQTKQKERATKKLEIQSLENEKQQEEQAIEPPIEDFVDVAYSFEHQQEEQNQQELSKEKDNEQQKIEEAEEVVIPPTTTVTENFDYELPTIDLLGKPAYNAQQYEKSHIQSTVKTLEKTFHSFGVKAKVTKVHVGPAVTKYEIYPEAGVKVSKIVSLHDDLALALAAQDIRIEAPIPGKSAVGIEVPNTEVAMVSLREILEATTANSSKLLFALGRDISGEAVVGELNKMPHLLIAGSTGSGKSVCINGIITSVLMRTKPHEVKLMMIDPKKVELNVYNGIPHLLTPVVTEPKKASQALKKVVAEMERRYELFSETGTRNMQGYNDYVHKHNEYSEEKISLLPFIVVIVDELADLMMVAAKDVEDSITRLAQMARAAGIHLIIATQRPSVDVITGVIKANIPSRIAFSVSSQIDSRTILDMGGAEKLLGRGDMLYIPVGASKPIRVQGAFLSDEEVQRVVQHCISQQEVDYVEEMIPENTTEVTEQVEDELYEDAVQMVVEMQTASVSLLQRRFRIGYTRAARLIDAMEDRGVVGPYEGSKPRSVLVSVTEEEQTPPNTN